MNKETLQKNKTLLDPKEFDALHQKGKIFLNELPMNADTYSEFRTLIRFVEEIYPSMWDFSFGIISGDIINLEGIMILFPEITINNRDKKTHLIKDLLVNLIVTIQTDSNKKQRLQIHRIKGARLTLSRAEYMSNYCHSHLSQGGPTLLNENGSFPYFTSFCTGSGDINIYQANLNAEGFKEETVVPYLLQIHTLVGYESIEGTPYRHIRNISERFQGDRNFNILNNKVDDAYRIIFSHYKINKFTIPLNFEFRRIGGYVLKIDEALDNFFENFKWTEIEKAIYFSAHNNGYELEYVQNATAIGIPRIPESKKFLFRGEERKLKIETKDLDTKEIAWRLNPRLKELLIQKINYETNNETIQRSSVTRYKNQNGNARKSVSPNSIFMQGDSQS